MEKEMVSKDKETQNRDKNDKKGSSAYSPVSDEKVGQMMAWLLCSSLIPYIWRLLVSNKTSSTFNLLYILRLQHEKDIPMKELMGNLEK